MCKTLHKSLLVSINIGYITVENLSRQGRSPIEGSVFSDSFVANICQNEGTHNANNIFKNTIVHKALEGCIRLSTNVQFWLNWSLLSFFMLHYLLLGLLLYKLSKWKLLNYGLKIHNNYQVSWCRIYQHDMHPMRTSRACITSMLLIQIWIDGSLI